MTSYSTTMDRVYYYIATDNLLSDSGELCAILYSSFHGAPFRYNHEEKFKEIARESVGATDLIAKIMAENERLKILWVRQRDNLLTFLDDKKEFENTNVTQINARPKRAYFNKEIRNSKSSGIDVFTFHSLSWGCEKAYFITWQNKDTLIFPLPAYTKPNMQSIMETIFEAEEDDDT
jgi:hypothetical protein